MLYFCAIFHSLAMNRQTDNKGEERWKGEGKNTIMFGGEASPLALSLSPSLSLIQPTAAWTFDLARLFFALSLSLSQNTRTQR